MAARYAHDHVRVAHKEAKTFRDLGCDVTLICRRPPGDRYLEMRTVPARGAGSRLGALCAAPLLALQALRLDADLYVAVNPFSIPAALVLASTGRRVVYSTYEDFTQKALVRPHLPKGFRTLVGYAIVMLEQLLSKLAYATIVTQPDIEPRYARSLLIENAPLLSGPVIEEARRIYAKHEPRRLPTLIYSGAMNRERGLFTMLDVVAELNETQPWRLTLVGEISSSDLAAAMAHRAWCHVDHLGVVSHARSLAEIRCATFGLGLLADVGGYSRTSMTKLYEYMLLETPFVVSDFRRWRESIRDVPAGLFVDPDHPPTIAARIAQVYADSNRYRAMQSVGRRYIEQIFSWELVSQPLHRLLHDIELSRELPWEA